MTLFGRSVRVLFLAVSVFWSTEILVAKESGTSKQPLRLAYSYDLIYHESEDGRPLGMLVPMIDLLRNEFGLDVEIRNVNRNEGFRQIESGDVDFYAMVGLNAGRREKYRVIEPLYRAEGVVVTRYDRPVHSLVHLKGRKVGFLCHTALADAVANFIDSEENLVFFPTLPLLLDALENGEVDAVAVVDGPEIEILRRPNLRFEFTISNYFTDQGIICINEEFFPLVERINAFLRSSKGERLRREIAEYRNNAIMESRRKILAKEIEYVRKRFEAVDMYDGGIFYPLCYKEDGEFKGLVVDINRVFTQLTGLEVRVGELGCGKGGISAAIEKIRTGECQVIGGAYANTPQWRHDALGYSPPLWIDTVRPYSYGRKRSDVQDALIGVPPNLARYFPWQNITKQLPLKCDSGVALIDDLKKNKLDVIVLGDMCLHYQYTVLKDFDFQPIDPLMVDVEMHMVYGLQHEELNRLFDEAIRLYPVLYPHARGQWKKMAGRASADYIRAQETGYRMSLTLSAALVLLVVAILLILHRFVKYDWQIRKLLRKQQNFDLAWVDLRRRRFNSKGGHPFFQTWGLPLNDSVCDSREMSRVFGRDLETEYRADLKKMKDEGLNFVVMDSNIVSPLDGERKYYRRFIHRIDDNRLMLCLQDTNAQHESERQEQFLIQLFEAFKDGLLFVGKDFKVLRYNRAMEELFPDFNAEKTFCFDCLRKRSVPCDDCPVRKTFEDGQKHSKVEFNKKSDRWLELTSYPILDRRTGKVDRVLEFIHDITEQRKRESELRLMQLIIDRISHPVFWLSLDGTVRYANDATAIAWGFSSTGTVPHGPVGDKVWRYVKSLTRENWQEFLDRFKDSNDRQFDTVMCRTDGSVFPAVVTVNLLEQQGSPFFAVACQDLTDQTRRIKAEQQALTKSSILDHLSHEIRTPLNGVIGIADLMLKTDLDERQREYVEMARISGQQLLSIISNILDYSTIDSGEMELEEKEFDLPELVESLRRISLALIAERKSPVETEWTVHPDVPRRILGDPVRLRQVVFNLLDNAIKFTPDGLIGFELSVLGTSQDRFLEFKVVDDGIGISEALVSELFEAFALGDNSFSRRYGGTGLGLPIARGLAHKMNGEIHAENRIAAGSEFRFVLPLREPDDAAEDSVKTWTSAQAPQGRKFEVITILVVEDNRINRIVTGEILKNAGYHYEFAENGLEACKAVAEKRFDFILMDCQMPVMDGFEATRRIREMESDVGERQAASDDRIPIVALTANALAGDEQNCLEAGMDGFCSKPINAEQLLEVIQRWTDPGLVRQFRTNLQKSKAR